MSKKISNELASHLNFSLIENDFNTKLSQLKNACNSSDGWFFETDKYLIRKLFVHLKRKNKFNLNYFLVLGSVKFDSFFLLNVKTILNIFLYSFVLPIVVLFKFNRSDTLCESSQKYNGKSVHYPNSVNAFRRVNKINNIIDFKSFLRGIKATKIIKFSLVKNFYKIFGIRMAIQYIPSTIIKYSLYTFFFGCMDSVSKRFNLHICRSALLPMQKIISTTFVNNKKKSEIIAHGIFYDPMQVSQIFTKYTPLNELFFPILDREYLELSCVCNVTKFNNQSVSEFSIVKEFQIIDLAVSKYRKSSKVCVFSSAYDPGLSRSNYEYILEIIQALHSNGFNKINLKLHPGEWKGFMKLLLWRNNIYNVTVTHDKKLDYDFYIGIYSTYALEIPYPHKVYIYNPILSKHDKKFDGISSILLSKKDF
jgi:hypothetical protein